METIIQAEVLYSTLDKQADYLIEILSRSKVVGPVINLASELALQNWYLGAGCISQTIWNYLHGFDLESNIKDCDLVYFDTNISVEAQERNIQIGRKVFQDIYVEVDIVNEARVHLWHKDYFGFEIAPYTSTEEAISKWPTTATCVGVTKQAGKVYIYAPYGLSDLLGMIVRPNKILVSKEMYMKKSSKVGKYLEKSSCCTLGLVETSLILPTTRKKTLRECLFSCA